MMDALASSFVKDSIAKAKKVKVDKKALAKRRALHDEARKIAFAHDSQLLGAGNRRISLTTGELVRRTSLYNAIEVGTPVLAGYHDNADSSDDEDASPAELKWGAVHRAIRSGREFTTLGFEDQTKEDLLQLLEKAPTNAIKPPWMGVIKSPRKQNSKVATSLLQNHAADHLGMTAANSKFANKSNQRFQAVTPRVRPPPKKQTWLPKTLRGLTLSPNLNLGRR
jgi:hypothetical protein